MRRHGKIQTDVLDVLRKTPKADLHVHLEGCVDAGTLQSLATRNGVSLTSGVQLPGGREIPPPTPEHVQHGFDSGDFRDFIRLYVKISECIRTSEDFSTIARSYARSAAADGVVAAEVYVTPTTLLMLGVSQEALFEGLKLAEIAAMDEGGIELRWIFDIVRNSPLPGEKTIGIALEARARGLKVEAIGLAGLEAGFPASLFAADLTNAHDNGFRILVHAGETAPAESVWDTIRSCSPERIGHGVTAADDETLLAELRARDIVLELCPASNVALQVLPLHSAALKKICNFGVPFVIGSDDPGIFRKSVLDNYVMAGQMGVSDELLLQAAERSLKRKFGGR